MSFPLFSGPPDAQFAPDPACLVESSSPDQLARVDSQSNSLEQWRVARIKNLHGPGFEVGPSYEDAFLKQIDSTEWKRRAPVDWIPPTQIDEIVRQCDKAAAPRRRLGVEHTERTVFSPLPRRDVADR